MESAQYQAKKRVEALLGKAKDAVRRAQDEAAALRDEALQLAPEALGLQVGDRILCGWGNKEAEVVGFEISYGSLRPKCVAVKKDGTAGVRSVYTGLEWVKK